MSHCFTTNDSEGYHNDINAQPEVEQCQNLVPVNNVDSNRFFMQLMIARNVGRVFTLFYHDCGLKSFVARHTLY